MPAMWIIPMLTVWCLDTLKPIIPLFTFPPAGISVLLPLAALCSASALPRAEEDAWLAVINGNSAPGPQQLQQEPAGDQTRYQPRPADPRQPRPDNRRVGVAPPPPPQQQPRLPPPPQQRGPPRAPVEVPQPRPGGVPPPQRRGPPPPQQRRPPPPPPPKKEPGLLDTVVQGVNSVLNPVSCAATNLITDEKLKDETFIKSQMDCAMNRGPCDDIGKQIRSTYKYLRTIILKQKYLSCY